MDQEQTGQPIAEEGPTAGQAAESPGSPMRQEDYRVRLDMFQGPLDLLLYLIQRAEVDVADVPLAEVTDQYLAFLHQIDDVDVELAGDFLVMAATLIEVKSRTLAPAEKPDGEDGEDGESGGGKTGTPTDPGYELIQQLMAYQRFRIAAEEMDSRRQEFSRRYPVRAGRHAVPVEEAEPIELELEDVHLFDLSEAYERIISSIDLTRLGDHRVEMDDTPIALYQEDLLDRLAHREDRRMTLQNAFEGSTRIQRIGLFMATLELVRLRRVTVVQEEIESDIEIALLEDEVGEEAMAEMEREQAAEDAGQEAGE